MKKSMAFTYLPLLVAVAAAANAGCSAGGSEDEDDHVGNETSLLTNNGAADPGPRAGVAGAGAPLVSQPFQQDDLGQQAQVQGACFPGLSGAMQQLCAEAILRFQEFDSIAGTQVSTGLEGFIDAGTMETGTGLGPGFNNTGCFVCHSQPGVLGAGVGPKSPQFPGVPNPQVGIATLDHAKNTVPSFITADGPIREVRFKTDNGVHDLYSIAGRDDAPGCAAVQPPFAAQLAAGNVSFRIPLPTFGDGLVEEIPEAALAANLAAAQANTQFKTGGTFNLSGNDGTITRFGWKAQNKSLLMFAGEAYNVEQGVSNQLFTTERNAGLSNLTGCFGLIGAPEDNNAYVNAGATPTAPPTVNKDSFCDTGSDIANFTLAMELSAPPIPATDTIPVSFCEAAVGAHTANACAIAAEQGQDEFTQVGCANCHSTTFTTPAVSSFDPAMQNVTFHPFSDFAIHNMGPGLADGITQGNAGPQQFRTAPLWGVGQRLFFLHDGRTSDLAAAIAAHATAGSTVSEATTVIDNFNALSKADQAAILVFLRSL
jgi:hypothetical protein